MPKIFSKTIIKLVMSPLVSGNYFILCFQGQSPLLTNFSILRGVKLKFGEGVNSEFSEGDFIFDTNFAKQNIFDKNIRFIVIFVNFIRPLFNKSDSMVT